MQTIPAYHGYLLENIRYFYNQIAQFANAVLWIKCKFSECLAPLNKYEALIEDFVVTVLPKLCPQVEQKKKK